MNLFKKLLLCLLFIAPASVLAQSKFSYSLLTNTSASVDDEVDICITRINGGECISLERSWKLNVTAAANYQVNKRIRLQSGLAYNVLSLDKVNEALERDAFKIRYLSIPVTSHFFITTGKVRVYTGAGIRTDIRLNSVTPPDPEIAVTDNGGSLAVSLKALLGVEVNISPQLAFNFEPTFSKGITSYNKDPDIGALDFFSLPMMAEFPQRIGISFGLTYSMDRAAK